LLLAHLIIHLLFLLLMVTRNTRHCLGFIHFVDTERVENLEKHFFILSDFYVYRGVSERGDPEFLLLNH